MGTTPYGMAANQEMVAILGTIAAARAERPGDDLTSVLIAARDEGVDRSFVGNSVEILPVRLGASTG